jgi:hypothetical protein
MNHSLEDRERSIRALIPMVLFLLLLLVSSDNPGKIHSSLSKYHGTSELAAFDITGSLRPGLCNIDRLPDLQKHYEWALNNIDHNQFSLRNIISDFDHKTAQHLSHINKTRLSVKPLLLWRLNRFFTADDTGDLPVLS